MMKHREELELMEATLQEKCNKALGSNNTREIFTLSEELYKVKQDIETLQNEAELAYK